LAVRKSYSHHQRVWQGLAYGIDLRVTGDQRQLRILRQAGYREERRRLYV
jgi:hypothetical protein